MKSSILCAYPPRATADCDTLLQPRTDTQSISSPAHVCTYRAWYNEFLPLKHTTIHQILWVVLLLSEAEQLCVREAQVKAYTHRVKRTGHLLSENRGASSVSNKSSTHLFKGAGYPVSDAMVVDQSSPSVINESPHKAQPPAAARLARRPVASAVAYARNRSGWSVVRLMHRARVPL